MASKPDLQTFLEELLGSENVYQDPPESVKMKYDAIRFSRKTIVNDFANNSVYKQKNCYEVIAICRDPDSDIVRKLSKIPMCKHDRHYVVNNLHHDAYTLYW